MIEFVIIFIFALGVVLWVKNEISDKPSASHEPSDPVLLEEMRSLYEELKDMYGNLYDADVDMELLEWEFSHPDYRDGSPSVLLAALMVDMDSEFKDTLDPEYEEPPPPPHIQRILIEAAKENRKIWKAEIEKTRGKELEQRQHIENVTRKHIDVLSRKYRQCAYLDEYNTIDLGGFENEISYFLSKTLPDVDGETAFPIVLEAVQQAVDLHQSDEIPNFDPAMSPQEFEILCGEALKGNGWDVRQVGGVGDQGCDLVVTKAGTKGVIQCKLYSSPVGNKAVQEVYSGRGWEEAEFAAVVTNNSFTKNAKQLAAKNEVHLLHFEDLPRLAVMVGIDTETVD